MYTACGVNRILLLKGLLTGYVMRFTTLCAIPNAGHNPRVMVMHIIISSDVYHMIFGLGHSLVRFRRIKLLWFGLKKNPSRVLVEISLVEYYKTHYFALL